MGKTTCGTKAGSVAASNSFGKMCRRTMKPKMKPKTSQQRLKKRSAVVCEELKYVRVKEFQGDVAFILTSETP